jgi:hypothetical protein
MPDPLPEPSARPELAVIAPPSAPLWRRALPFVLAFGLVAFVVRKLDFRTFARHLGTVNAPAFLAFEIAFVLALLSADTFATVLVYRRSVAPIRFRDFWILRGASYLPSVLNHHVGQAFITYFVARRYGTPLARVAGATLLVYASWSGCVLGLGCLALLLNGKPLLWLAAVLAAGVLYLALIAARPRRLAETKLLAPLFEAGVVGHLVALVSRIPHLVVLFLGTWIPFLFFGVAIPFKDAVAYIPILMVAVTLPITPQGFGTRDLLAGALFARFAPGDTDADRLAMLAAVTTSWGVAITLIDMLVGFALMRVAAVELEKPAERAPEPRSG